MSAENLNPLPPIRDVLTSYGITWQTATIHETKRGKLKPIVTGIPSALFWRRYKHGLRSHMTALGLSIKRHAKNQWEVICWPRTHSIPVLEELGFVLPEIAPKKNDENPF